MAKCQYCGYDLHIENGKCRTCRQPANKPSNRTINIVQCPKCNSVRIRYCSQANAIICMDCDNRWKVDW